jgi:hypothetical protein
MMFSAERTIELILEFHRYEDRKRQIRECRCPVLDGPGYAIYNLAGSNKSVQVSPETTILVFDASDTLFNYQPLDIIRRNLPPLLKWFWVERFNLEKNWYVPEPWEGFTGFDWGNYQQEVIDRCIGATDYYGIACHFRTDHCPCAMVSD